MCLPPSDGVAFESAGRKRLNSGLAQKKADDDEPRVTFHQQGNQVHEIPTALSCIGGDRSQLWYNRMDIQGFRRNAQSLSLQLRQGSTVDDYTRGLELRTSLQRQDRKQLVVKRILDAQDEDSTPDELAIIAKEHSIWSRKLARAQAHKDYYAAYHPTLTSVLPEMPALLDCHKDVVTKKRSLLGSSMPGRRVRCRMF